jgi:hypothetical protein
VVAEPPLDGVVLPLGVALGLDDGDVGGVVLGLGVVVGLGDWNGGAVEARPELYGVGLGLQLGAILGELDAEGYDDWLP